MGNKEKIKAMLNVLSEKTAGLQSLFDSIDLNDEIQANVLHDSVAIGSKKIIELMNRLTCNMQSTKRQIDENNAHVRTTNTLRDSLNTVTEYKEKNRILVVKEWVITTNALVVVRTLNEFVANKEQPYIFVMPFLNKKGWMAKLSNRGIQSGLTMDGLTKDYKKVTMVDSIWVDFTEEVSLPSVLKMLREHVLSKLQTVKVNPKREVHHFN